jgi:undecaprenyl diphosphate synthase
MKALLEELAPDNRNASGDASVDLALAQAIDPARIPAHIAIIMDGNGRWARRRRMPRVAGHNAGVDAVRSTVETCARMGVRALTLYAFSVDNWKRPRTEVETLWHLLRLYLDRELPLLMRHDIRFGAVGRLHELPEGVRSQLAAVARHTANNRGLKLNLAINYGGRAELVDAVKALVEDARRGPLAIDEAAISARLYTAGLPDPDLLIRTSGEMRVSNFLLWQIAYAELYVTETLWPDFNRAELLRAVLDYQKRDRRFGGIGEAPMVAADRAPRATPDVLVEAFPAPAR